ncbi:MAG: hypothetical protein ACTJHU_03535 [Mycetocola sp.]
MSERHRLLVEPQEISRLGLARRKVPYPYLYRWWWRWPVFRRERMTRSLELTVDGQPLWTLFSAADESPWPDTSHNDDMGVSLMMSAIPTRAVAYIERVRARSGPRNDNGSSFVPLLFDHDFGYDVASGRETHHHNSFGVSILRRGDTVVWEECGVAEFRRGRAYDVDWYPTPLRVVFDAEQYDAVLDSAAHSFSGLMSDRWLAPLRMIGWIANGL